MKTNNANKILVPINEFAKTLYTLLKSDRDVVVGVGGFTGEGKSCFTTQLLKEYSNVSGMAWDFSMITWSRSELMEWIDGKKGSAIDPQTKLREGQLPEYSPILADELFYMFYRRTWFDDGQISGVATFNSCRDRHLLVCGNVPDFWDLDSGFLTRVRFYVYIVERGRAWVFQQENNPFSHDPWNVQENKKQFRKHKHPYSIPNFIMEIHFDDWTAKEKEDYYQIRNEKRVKAIQNNKVKQERYKDIKDQRDNAIRSWLEDRVRLAENLKKLFKSDIPKEIKEYKTTPSNKFIADSVGIDEGIIRIARGNKE